MYGFDLQRRLSGQESFSGMEFEMSGYITHASKELSGAFGFFNWTEINFLLIQI